MVRKNVHYLARNIKLPKIDKWYAYIFQKKAKTPNCNVIIQYAYSNNKYKQTKYGRPHWITKPIKDI